LIKDSGKSSKKRKKETDFEKSKRLKSEETPKGKKPINLKKATPTRKRLQPNINQMLEEDPLENEEPNSSRKKKKEGIVYDDVYTRKEMNDKQSTSIQKIRQLQQNELQCIMDQGTYVQCCDCNKWRLVKEYEDPSLVPEYWICSMNKDDDANDCSKGDGDDVESDEEFVSVDYSCGSMVWVKFSGYPWWPGMVDYCPEVEETFLIDVEVNCNEAAKYHVVFFDKTTNVARAWMNKDLVMKMLDPEEPPKPPIFKNDNIKKRYQHAKSMAVDSVNLPRIERIEKYSFASLYTGKWGDKSDNSEDLDRRSTEIDIDTRLIGIAGFQQPPGMKKKPAQRKIKRKIKKTKEKRFQGGKPEANVEDYSWETNFQCLKCSQEVKFSRNFVKNHLRKHRLNFQEYLDKYDIPENKEKLHRVRQWVQNEEYLTKISEVAERRRSRSRSRSQSRKSIDEKETTQSTTSKDGDNEVDNLLSQTPDPTEENPEPAEPDLNDELLNAILDHNSIEAKDEPLEIESTPITNDASIPSPEEANRAEDDPESRNSSIIMKLVDETDTSEKDKVNRPKIKEKSSKTANQSPKKKGVKPTKKNKEGYENGDEGEHTYSKPPMSPELLIAIAVRNLDPHKDVGASCTDIVAFLSLHFPYFNDHYDECKDMVRRECGMSSSFESGRENFQMKAEINCGDRIHTYVQNNRDKICHSMLEPEFLDTIIDRFVKENSMISPNNRKLPPFDKKMLTHIALMKLYKRATLEQIVILLKFIFPALAQSGVMETYRKEFLEEIAKGKELDAKVDKNNITFVLRDGVREEILDQIRACALENLEIIGESLLNESFFDLILPIFQNSE